MLDAGNTTASKLFKESGHVNLGDGSDPEAKLDALAKTYAAENSVTFAKAYSIVTETGEGKDLYEKSLN